MKLCWVTGVGMLLLFANLGFAEVYKSSRDGWTKAKDEEVQVSCSVPYHFDVADTHQITPRIKARIEPWINADITATEMNWFIRAPQTYLAQFFKLTVHANGKEGFKLTISGSRGLKSDTGSSLGTWYAFVTEKRGQEDRSRVIPSEFLQAGDQFNSLVYNYTQGPLVMNFYLWNKVKVDTLTPAEEYEDEFTVTISCGI